MLATIGTRSVDEGKTLTFTLSATDPDADTLVFSATGLPGGATFVSATKTFQWTPDYTQSGNYSIHFEVSDGIYKDEENIIIIVYNVNRAPAFTSVPSNGSMFNETDNINMTVAANDPEYQRFVIERNGTPSYLPPGKLFKSLEQEQKIYRMIMEKAGILKEK